MISSRSRREDARSTRARPRMRVCRSRRGGASWMRKIKGSWNTRRGSVGNVKRLETGRGPLIGIPTTPLRVGRRPQNKGRDCTLKIGVTALLRSKRCAMEQTSQPQLLGRYIVADLAICHDKPTFRGTRIMVADVLE